MALFARLRCIRVFEKPFKLNLVPKTNFHSLSKGPISNPIPGTRSFFLKLFKKPTQTDLKKADDIPDTFDMIYRNAMSKYILGAQVVSIVCGGLVLVAFLMKTDYKTFKRTSLEWTEHSKPKEYEEFYYIAVFIVFLVVMQNMVSRTPIRIYKVPRTSKYIAINYGNYFFGKERYSFQRGEISRSVGADISPWKEHKYVIEKPNDRKSVILVDYYFRRPADLSIMLGEQRDPDLGEEIKSS